MNVRNLPTIAPIRGTASLRHASFDTMRQRCLTFYLFNLPFPAIQGNRLLPLQNHTCIVFSPYLLPTSSLSYNKDEVGRR